MSTKSKVSFQLMSGADAEKPENILELFEQIKGRKATDEEVAELRSLQAGTPTGAGTPH